MKEKFTYYDFVANIIPGFFLVWALNSISKDLIFGNVVTESLMFIILAYVLGLIIQYFSKYSIEYLVKRISWKGTFFSNIYLIKEANKCSDQTRKRYLNIIKKKYSFSDKELKILDTKNIFDKKNKTKLKKAQEISYSIFRSIDYHTYDKGIAKKAHVQNNHYSLFRGLSFSFLFIGLLFSFLISQSIHFQTFQYIMYTSLSFLFCIIFLIRTKERGESYVKGLFESLK